MNIENLSGKDLDRAVAKANGWITYPDDSIEQGRYYHLDQKPFGPRIAVDSYTPSTKWFIGGNIIEDYNISILYNPYYWIAQSARSGQVCRGSTPLEAAMRCYVASVLGEEVEC